MRKIIVSEFITLDGVFEDPGGSEGSPNGGWSMQYNTEQSIKFKYDELFDADALLLGRITYDGFAKVWPTMPDTGDFGERMNSIPKYVVTNTLAEGPWNNTIVIAANAAAEISALKQQDGKDILVFGSGELVRSLLEYGLVDEIRLMVHPIVLGNGKQLFGGAPKTKLKLEHKKEFDSGSVVLTYVLDKIPN